MATWLKQLRERQKMSQEELAARLQLKGFDVSRGTISHWEQGRYKIPLDNPEIINALSAVLDVDVIEILASAGYQISIDGLSEIEKQALEVIRSKTLEQQQRIIEIIRLVS
jgi:transcriptional regulator with XRE-family HTH domain